MNGQYPIIKDVKTIQSSDSVGLQVDLGIDLSSGLTRKVNMLNNRYLPAQPVR